MIKMHYSVYKRYYSQYPTGEYNKNTKQIEVDLPKINRVNYPQEFKKISGGLRRFNHVNLWIRNSGYSEYYEVETTRGISKHITINPSLTARQEAINMVYQLAREITWSDEDDN
jgi:hypothetical protein